MRLFVAVWPSAEVVDVLARFERPSVDGVRWTSASQWHVTLRFFGEVAESSVADVEAWLRSSCASLGSAEARLGDATARFGRSVLHVPVDGLSSWATAVSGEVPGVALRTSEREGPFVGHVTLARARGRGSVASFVGAALPAGARSWTADSIALVRSDLGRGGSTYTGLAVVPIAQRS